jgi:hypothetical protein
LNQDAVQAMVSSKLMGEVAGKRCILKATTLLLELHSAEIPKYCRLYPDS